MNRPRFGVSADQIRTLNPKVRKGQTVQRTHVTGPPGGKVHTIEHPTDKEDGEQG